MPDIRNQIATIIQDRALKQCTIAHRAGLTPDQFCAVLKKRRKLDANELLRVCDAMGMTPNQVATYSATDEGDSCRADADH